MAPSGGKMAGGLQEPQWGCGGGREEPEPPSELTPHPSPGEPETLPEWAQRRGLLGGAKAETGFWVLSF